MLEILLSQTVSGLVLGGLYVLIAIGLSIIFGLLGIVNFAHGAFFTLGAYFALTLVELFGWPAVLLSPIIVGGIGMVAERLLIRPRSAASCAPAHEIPRWWACWASTCPGC
jgi:branched-chain amino acid transport system permease protein